MPRPEELRWAWIRRRPERSPLSPIGMPSQEKSATRRFGEVGDGEADFLIDALVERLVLAEAMAAAFAVGDEFLEDLIHVGGGEDSEEFEFLHALVGMDVNRAGGAHLDVRDTQFAADAEDDAQQVPSAHAGTETRRPGCRGVARKRWRFENCEMTDMVN